jgi:large repetitive protein
LTLASGPNAGGYRFDLLPGAPAGNYTIKITPPVGYTDLSSVLLPQAGTYTPPALPGAPVSLGSGKAPQAGEPTSYYLAFNLTPGTSRDVIHNNIPLDTTDSGALFIRKEVNRASVEIGDALTYRVTVRSTRFAGPGKIVDRLPVGFKLIPNTTKVGVTTSTLIAVADPAGTPGPQLTFSVNLPINQEVVIEYKVRVGIAADRGDGTNRAQAQLGALRSLEAQAKVKVTGGVFTRDACVIGKVFVDCNQNQQQDAGEPGIPGVRLYLEDGTNITTDENGQYSMCGLRPITHVLKIDSSTMPIGSRMGISSSRNAGDADSLFVDLTAHELYRADFIEQSCFPKVLEQVNQRRKLGPVLVPQKHDEGKDEKWNIQFNSEQHKLDRTPSVNEGGRP